MTTETLITTKITPRTLMLVRKIAEKTGEKQYRLLERLVSAAYQRVVVNETKRLSEGK